MSEEPQCVKPEVYDHPKQQIQYWIGNRFGGRVPRRLNSSPVARKAPKMLRRILRKNVMALDTRPLEVELRELRNAEQEIHRLSTNSHESRRYKAKARQELRSHKKARSAKLQEQMLELKMTRALSSTSSADSSDSASSDLSKSPTSNSSTPE